MNDFDYDVMQKKRIARGVYHRKGTTNRKGCRLPHENLTKKELNAMNGEVITVNMLEKLNWKEFNALPKDLQTEYLQHTMDRFGVGLNTISVDLFGLSNSYLSVWAKRNGIELKLRTGGRLSKAAMESWKRWISYEDKIAPTDDIPQTPYFDPPEPTVSNETKEETPVLRAHDWGTLTREYPPIETPVDTTSKDYPTSDLSITLKGNPNDILRTLLASLPTVLDGDKRYRFQLKVDTFTL